MRIAMKKPMKKTAHNTALMLAWVASLALSTPTYAILGVGDIVFDPQALAANMQQLASWAQQLQQMRAQLTQQTGTLQAMTGNRGLGNVLPLANSTRNYLPQGASDMLGVLNNTNNSYAGMGSQIQALVRNNAILSNASLTNMNMSPAQQKLLTDSRTNAAAIQSISAQGMANASARFGYLQSLMSQINATTDPKAIAELNARIEAEQTMMTNEQTKLQQTLSLMQSRGAVTEQQKNEMAIQQTGSISTLQQPDLSHINFN
jgi:type IV secretion system protein VirB5